MMTFRKNGVIVDQAKSDPNYIPTFETERDKPDSLFVDNEEKTMFLSSNEIQRGQI